MNDKSVDELDLIERAMVEMRRSQSRRSLMRLSGARDAGEAVPQDGAVYDALDVISAAQESGEPIGVRELAARLSVDQPRASKLAAAAVSAGFVLRRADQSDGRRTLLVVTETGGRLLARIRLFRRSVVERVTRDWTAAERSDFARLFHRFAAAVSGLDGPEPPRNRGSGSA